MTTRILHPVKTAFLLGACAAAFSAAHAAESIANAALTVTCSGGVFSVTERAGDKTVVTQGRLDGVDASATAREEAANDPVFGSGRKLVFARKAADGTGGEISLETYPELPFVLVRETVANTTDKPVDLQKIVPAVFTLDLGKPASKLVTMGTGGLSMAGVNPAAEPLGARKAKTSGVEMSSDDSVVTKKRKAAPKKDPGSYLFLTAADPETRAGLVTGWLTQFKGSGTVIPAVANDTIEFKPQIEHGHLILAPGKSATLDTFAIGHFADARLGEEALASAIARAHAIKLRPKQATYCTWYSEGPGHGGAGNETTTVELAQFCAKARLPEFGLGVIQIDDKWQAGTPNNSPAQDFERVKANGPYKDGFAKSVKAVEDAGMTFGLWWMPFGRNHTEENYKDRQDWFFKRPDGTPLKQDKFGGTCLDSSVPAVAEHLEHLGKLIRSRGVKYFKMDGFSAGAGVDQAYINDGYKNDNFGKCLPAHDASLTNIEVMRKGVGHVRKGAGDDVFFSACAASQSMRMYAGTIGLVDSMRVGPDFGHDGEGVRSGVLRGSRVYFLNGKVWWNDPDPSKVRSTSEGNETGKANQGGVSLEQARLTTSWVAVTDQFFLLSDWIPNLPAERLDILKRTMHSHGATVRPVDYFDHNLADTWLVTSDKSGVRRDVVGIFNYYESPMTADYTLAKVGLDAGATYHAFDFWENKPVVDISGKISAELAPMSCRVLALRAKADHPVLVSTSRHVSQGILEVTAEKWEGSTLAGSSKLIGAAPYELRIAGLKDGKGWKFAKASVSAGDASAGVTVESIPAEDGWARVKIVSPVSREVKWTVSFE